MVYEVGSRLVSVYSKQRKIRSALDAAETELPSGKGLFTSSASAAHVSVRSELTKNIFPDWFDILL